MMNMFLKLVHVDLLKPGISDWERPSRFAKPYVRDSAARHSQLCQCSASDAPIGCCSDAAMAPASWSTLMGICFSHWWSHAQRCEKMGLQLASTRIWSRMLLWSFIWSWINLDTLVRPRVCNSQNHKMYIEVGQQTTQTVNGYATLLKPWWFIHGSCGKAFCNIQGGDQTVNVTAFSAFRQCLSLENLSWIITIQWIIQFIVHSTDYPLKTYNGMNWIPFNVHQWIIQFMTHVQLNAGAKRVWDGPFWVLVRSSYKCNRWALVGRQM